MQAEFSVELGRDDSCLEIPWSSDDGKQRYFDLKEQPELLLEIVETHDNRELAEFLSAINQPTSRLQTAKCDTWLTDELDEEDEIFGTEWKYGAYVDVIFADEEARLSFEAHEEFGQTVAKLLAKAPDFAASAEVVVRRCYYHRDSNPFTRGTQREHEESDSGFYLTLYIYGFGDDEAGAKKSWVIGLKLLQNALIQVSAQARR